MTRFQMNTLEPVHPDAFNLAAEAYEASDTFDADAVEYLTESGDLPANIVLLAREHYRESTLFATRVEDALDGETCWT